jgi:hypothetical protein
LEENRVIVRKERRETGADFKKGEKLRDHETKGKREWDGGESKRTSMTLDGGRKNGGEGMGSEKIN